MRLDIPGGPPDLLAPPPPLDAVGVRGKRSTKIRQRLISVLYTVLGVGLFFAAWWCAASQLPRSRLVTPLDAGRDIWANFFYSPRLGVFGLGEVGYGSLLLYTVGNVLVGLVIGGAIGILIGTASARLKLLRVFVDPIVLVFRHRAGPGGRAFISPLVRRRPFHPGPARDPLQRRHDDPFQPARRTKYQSGV